jgi:hypothetical protein
MPSVKSSSARMLGACAAQVLRFGAVKQSSYRRQRQRDHHAAKRGDEFSPGVGCHLSLPRRSYVKEGYHALVVRSNPTASELRTAVADGYPYQPGVVTDRRG